ncbi:MAG TPA: Rrf2 family transcriptional regulator [Candidatus Syntrophosphaera sp.]|nr:Rrf2 family transcriptional regulator [Candidatus Syntrophosphaera sp.]
MAVNTRTEYALRALLEISAERQSVSAQTICKSQCLPKKYIEHLLSALKNAGLISSSTGSRGGYTLARPARLISLYDVLEAVEDRNSELDCREEGSYCLGSSCGLRAVFDEVATKQRALLRSYTLDKIGRIWKKGQK